MRTRLKLVINVIILLPLLWSSMISCINTLADEESASDNSAPGTTPITVTASNLHQQIYSDDDESGFGLYVLLGDNTLDKSRYISNAYFKSDVTGFQSLDQLYFPSGNVKTTLIGYYPYSEVGIKDGEEQMQVEVKLDQSSLRDYNSSDFMVARASNISSTYKSISLSYVHQLSQLSIQIKCPTSADIADLLELKPQVFVLNTFTTAQYHFNTAQFSDYTSRSSITPYGQWSIDGSRLQGKACVAIPQTIPAQTAIALLVVGERSYECRLADEYTLENGKTNILTLSYDPKQGISTIQVSINDWIEGGSSDVVTVDRVEKDYISINELNFSKSNVFTVFSKGVKVAEICKELLKNEQLNQEAVVIYLAREGLLSRDRGVVWQLLNVREDLHGGEVNWDNLADSFTYIPGKRSMANDVYFTKDTLLAFDKPSEALMLTVEDEVLVDYRVGEVVTYPIVKIGRSYWLRDDLRATRYTTGKNITKKSSQNYDKTTAGYFKVDPFVFYNKAAILTGNVAPIGWRVSTKRDWDRLNSYVSGNSSYIKKNGVWLDLFYDANNSTGFSVVPSGFFGEALDEKVSCYGFANKHTAYWQMDNNGLELFDLGILLKCDTDEFNNASFSDFSGYCVRCVRE